MSARTIRAAPIDRRPEGIAMSTEIERRIGSLLAEAEARRLAARTPRAGLRRRLGRAFIAFGHAVEGRVGAEGRLGVDATERRPCPPAASARA